MEKEMRKTWVEWKVRRATINGESTPEELDEARVHLRWMARTIIHLQDELWILSSIHRSKGYEDHYNTRRIHV